MQGSTAPMCELFAMSSRLPATVSFSLDEFTRRGGLTGPHRDGWGIAWYDGLDARIVREPLAAASSVCVQFIQTYPFESQIVISHVRHATQGDLALRNTQPFCRELGGRVHVFAHNGHLADVRSELAVRSFRPVGDTDSEHAFCALLDQLRELWTTSTPPSLEGRVELITAFAASIRPLGPANFVYSDGDILLVHGDRRKHEPGAAPRPPGIHVLQRTCPDEASRFEGAGVEITSPAEQRVVLAASVPLTDERWEALGDGEIRVARAGAWISP